MHRRSFRFAEPFVRAIVVDTGERPDITSQVGRRVPRDRTHARGVNRHRTVGKLIRLERIGSAGEENVARLELVVVRVGDIVRAAHIFDLLIEGRRQNDVRTVVFDVRHDRTEDIDRDGIRKIPDGNSQIV